MKYNKEHRRINPAWALEPEDKRYFQKQFVLATRESFGYPGKVRYYIREFHGHRPLKAKLILRKRLKAFAVRGQYD
jgi:hypothetical protein